MPNTLQTRIDITLAMDAFTAQYVETALWSSASPDADSEGPQITKEHVAEDISIETLQQMVKDCGDFQEAQGHLYPEDEAAGHDFWLTRSGHGAGFWDGDYPEESVALLCAACTGYGSYELYMGDGGLIYGA